MMQPAVTLYWIPLGAGGHVVRHHGRVFEALVARREHREPRDLFHAALEVQLDGDRHTVEMGPAWNSNSLMAWLLARSGHDMPGINPPTSGRAPGWDAGLALAERQRHPSPPAH